jgi:hypothetical protein
MSITFALTLSAAIALLRAWQSGLTNKGLVGL